MVYYLVVISHYQDKQGEMELNDFFTIIKKNTWIYQDESTAQQQLQDLNQSQTHYEFSLIKFDLKHYRSIDLIGEFRIRHDCIKNFKLIRPCLTHNFLPEQIVDPQLKKGKMELYVFNFNRRLSEKNEKSTVGNSISSPTITQPLH